MFDFDRTMYMGMKSLNSTKDYAGVTSDALHTKALGPGIAYKKGSVPYGKLSYKFIEEYKNGKGHGLYYRYDQEDKYTEVGTLNEGKYVGPCFASKGNIKEGFLCCYDEYEKIHGMYVKFANNGMSFIVFQYDHGKLLDRCLIFKDWRIYRGKCSSLTDYSVIDDEYVKTSFFPHIFLSRLSSSLNDLELSEPRGVDCFNYYEVYKGDNVVRMRDKKFGYISGWNDKRLWSVLKTEKSQSFGEYSWAYNKFYGLRGIRYADGSASIGYMDECNAYESLYMNIQTNGIFTLKTYVKNKVDGTTFIVYDSCLLIKHYENGTQTRNVIKVCKDTLDVQMFTVNNEFIEAIPYDKVEPRVETIIQPKLQRVEQTKPTTVTPVTNVTNVKTEDKVTKVVQEVKPVVKPVEKKYYDNPQLKEIMSAFDYSLYTNGMILNKVITPMRYCCIPHNVIKIGKRAFIHKEFTKHLETVEFMKDVRVVEEGAFYDCENLTTLKLNEGLEEIEVSAFGSCKRLKRVIIPSTVKRIGNGAFRGTSVKEVAVPKGCVLEKNAFNDDTLVVYGSLDDLANYKKELERKIKEKEALEALALINARLKEIDKIEAEMDAIEEQERLAKEQEEKTRIKKEQDKIKREQRKIEKEKEKELALEKQKQEELALYKEMLENDPEERDRQNSYGASYEFMFNELIRYKDSNTNVIVPSFITEIRKDAFKDSNITSIQFRGSIKEEALEAIKGIETLKKVVIPNNIKYIPKGLFKNCKELECVYISSSVKEIGDGAFENCSSLKCVHFGSEFESLSIGTKAFKKCINLKEILLPKNTTIIGEEAFSGCKNLNSLLIPFETEKILSKAFKNCSSINKMVIPPKVYYFGEDVFYDCNYIEELKLCGKRYLNKGLSLDGLNIHTKIYHLLSVADISKLLTYKNYKKVYKLTNVDDELVLHQIEREDLYTKINKEYNNYKLKKTIISDKTKIEPTNIEVKPKRIEHNAYFEEEGIIVEIKPGVEELVIPEDIKSVGVKGKHNIKKLTINCNIEKLYLLDLIGYSQELEELILGDHITDISDLNRIKFPKLKMIKFGKNFKNINYQTFKDFKSLEIIEFHKESCVKLFHNAFEGCTNLKQVINSHVINNFVDYCFKDCKSLSEISFGKNLSFVGKGSFEGCCSLHTMNLDVDLNKARFIDQETIFNGCDMVRINHTCTRQEVLNLFKEIPGWIKKIKTVKVDKI